MPLHFTQEEFASRHGKVKAALAEQGLDGLLIFKQETMYYLTGYDTTGYSQFQGLYFGADGALALLTRSADHRQAMHTSLIKDIRIWMDREGASPAEDLKDMLRSYKCEGKRLGIELDAGCLTGARWDMVRHSFEGFCDLVDASNLVQAIRIVKSPAELEYVTKAAELGDKAMEDVYAELKPGVDEGHLFAVAHNAIYEGGGDYSAGRFIIGSGEGALLVRNFTGREKIGVQDQVQLEFGASYRHYHACIMRTALTGQVSPEHQRMHDACSEALAACQQVCKPGNLVGDVFDTHARILDDAGYSEHRLNACGYSLSANYPPTWMEQPMFCTGQSTVVQPNMVFFMHMILADTGRGLTMSLGETGVVSDTGFNPLSRLTHDLHVS
ncbi:M24 family metallopeptidase [Roseovarius sp. ZX-A-9]|uniref:M24 family metallopeptidase n=1 Tax=Roseovarius sp. ZX-A-9 TaxID=3014783 RepID=UPI00232E5A83|nr:Xaa-Pro peptidase family protein [Roseovarius sp. ZX-A-9]